jgi:hypothetical protein
MSDDRLKLATTNELLRELVSRDLSIAMISEIPENLPADNNFFIAWKSGKWGKLKLLRAARKLVCEIEEAVDDAFRQRLEGGTHAPDER